MKNNEYSKVLDIFDIRRKFVNEGSFKNNPHYHNAYEIHYFLSGNMNFYIGENNYRVKKGDIVFVDTFEIHNPILTSNECEKILMIFKPSILKANPSFNIPNVISILDENFSGMRLISLPEDVQRRVEGILFEMIEVYKKQNQYTLAYLHSYINIFMTSVSEYLSTIKYSSDNNILSSNKVKSIISYLNDNLDKELSLDSISNHFSINKYYLCRIFKENTGLSVINYINLKRILTAEKLITANGHSITEISLMVGFNNLTHFERTFKQITGVAPRNYKSSSINYIRGLE